MSAGASAPWAGRRIHLIGVGGAGMSGYARAARALGAELSGSDASSSAALEELAAEGVLEARVGHDPVNIPAGADVEVFYSSAVEEDNSERRAARERGLSEQPRAALLAELTALKRTLAVAGTHGKTTTASMLVHALREAGKEPSWLVGAPVAAELPNARWSEGEWLVVEADESDRSMLSLEVEIAVLTNVELDHHATFSSIEQVRDAFRTFLGRARASIVIWDRPELLALAPGTRGQPARLAKEDPRAGGAPELVTYDVPDPQLHPGGSTFEWRGNEVVLAVPGAHNALNAAAALEAAALAGADAARAVRGLAGFRGAARRFQLLGSTASGALVYDDYAHHPSEIAATIAAARTLERERVVVVFQPHLFSRTEQLATGFGRALARADVAVVLEIYPARERAAEHPGVSGLSIAESACDFAAGRPVYWLPRFEDAEPVLAGMLGSEDVCVAMGAGDVDALARSLLADARTGAA